MYPGVEPSFHRSRIRIFLIATLNWFPIITIQKSSKDRANNRFPHIGAYPCHHNSMHSKDSHGIECGLLVGPAHHLC